MKKIFLITYILSPLIGFTQMIKDVRAIEKGNTIEVLYDLYAGDNETHVINASLYYSIDNGENYSGPLRSVSGDLEFITPGKNKKITWDVTNDITTLIADNIVFKVEAKKTKNLGIAITPELIYEITNLEEESGQLKVAMTITNIESSKKSLKCLVQNCTIKTKEGDLIEAQSYNISKGKYKIPSRFIHVIANEHQLKLTFNIPINNTFDIESIFINLKNNKSLIDLEAQIHNIKYTTIK